MHDRFNGQHVTDQTAAIAAFERAVAALAAHRPLAGANLDEAVGLAPDFVAAHALKGFAALTLGRAELRPHAVGAAREARAAADRSGRWTAGEAALLDGLDIAVTGRFTDGAARLERQLACEPRNFLLLKVAHALRFMAGDLDGMLAATSAVLPHWTDAEPAAGYVYGCHAFGLEEAGRYAEAERYGMLALERAPDDAWGLHAISHVDEMKGRTREGIARLEASRALWSRCNNFQFHLAWHLALLHLEAGAYDRVLALYDTEIRPEPTDDYRDVANAASLLWRLRLAGIGVGDRWDELRALGRRRADDTTLMFASLHHMFALAAGGDAAAIDAVLASWEAEAAQGRGDQAQVAACVGLDLARVIAGRVRPGTDYARLARRLPALGGSNAQRDVFLQTLATTAARNGDARAVATVMATRHAMRGSDRFSRHLANLVAA